MTETFTKAKPDEFTAQFSMTVRYDLQVTEQARGWLREMRAEGASDHDIAEELSTRLLDSDDVNIVDSDAEIDFIDDLDLGERRERGPRGKP